MNIDSIKALHPHSFKTDRATALSQVVEDILAMQSPFHRSSLDPWLQDHLVNSLRCFMAGDRV